MKEKMANYFNLHSLLGELSSFHREIELPTLGVIKAAAKREIMPGDWIDILLQR